MQKLPVKLFRVAEVKELDRMAIEDYGIPGFELMSRAGQKVFDCIQAHCAEADTCAVVCGAGNNGGDGYIVARLATAAGLQTTVYSVVDAEKLQGDAKAACLAYLEAGGRWYRWNENTVFSEPFIVDALLGSGLDRPVGGDYAKAIEQINNSRAKVVAVDMPSGINADTGKVMGCAVKADYTVCFIGMKQGLLTGDAPEYCGQLLFSALNLPAEIVDRVDASARRVEIQPLPERNRCAHKGDNGHVLIVGGDMGFSGAARMAGEAALRVGAGLVSLATRPEHAAWMNLPRPELMCHGVIHPEQVQQLSAKARVIVLGPGLGRGAWARDLFNALIKSDKPLILDADALHLLAETASVGQNRVLTPHPGEAAGLLKCTVPEVERDRFAAAAKIQATYGGVCVLKGAGTLIAAETGIAVSVTGNPGMGSGGMGDILSGVIAALIAQGLSLQNAAEYGVYWHGQAADLAAQQGGERGLLATDLMPYLRRLVN
ncbi:MAG: bifunctional ADP-dependent NAD(P)H-hydrate dehydratase/NAD(P)H-hydrate epimerase [Gammaproteobacteria bacterium HGW-Gammaproteobacteria-3]|nr:MAG: bifunctional ADP-dependent NAD(P)H-hydrate dehydratase/NAD(P)H-hydrate epimerase [Gammaproteobacteria bacterium HGW-Gammaproteobacteria-3]